MATPPLTVPWVAQPTTVTCLPAAAAAALAFHGRPESALELAREVPVSRTGTSLFDVALAVERRGFRALVFQAQPDDLRRALAGGLPPIVVTSLQGDTATHAVVLTALTDDEATFVDPAAEAHRRDTAETLLAGHAVAGKATLLVVPAGVSLAAVGLTDDAAAQDRRFRARELVRRAEAHAEPNAQALMLYQQALGYWPESAEIRNNVARLLAANGRREEARRELEEVLRRDPTFTLAAENLRRLSAP